MRIALAVLVLIVAACSKRETQTITSWLRVEVLRPKADELIRVGRRAEIFEIQREGRWRRLGVGNMSRYMLAGDEDAVLVDLNDGKGLQLLRPNEPPRAIPASFGRMGTVYVPFPAAVDVVAKADPHRADVYRFDLSGNELAHFRISVPEAYSDCSVTEGLAGYGMDRVPYTTANCNADSPQAKCLILGAGDFLYAVPPEADWSECSNFGKAGISMMEPARFTVFD